MKIHFYLFFAFVSSQAFAEVKLFYNNDGELTIEEMATHYRVAEVDVLNKKFTGQINEFDLHGTKFLEINYDDRGARDGNFKYERFGTVIEGVFKNGVPQFSVPDSILNQLTTKEKFVQATYIRKNDYEAIKSILSPPLEALDSTAIFMVVEDMPYFPGGMTGMSKFLRYYLVYPAKAKEKGISGRVFVEFNIMQDGTVGNVKVIRGIGHGCDEAAHYAVSKLPDWTPGRQRGKAVVVKMVLPISFQ